MPAALLAEVEPLRRGMDGDPRQVPSQEDRAKDCLAIEPAPEGYVERRLGEPIAGDGERMARDDLEAIR